MVLYSLRAPLMILAAISCCSCSPLLPLKISGVKGKYATFPLTVPASFQPNAVKFSFVSSAGESIAVYDRVAEKVTVPPAYNGRVVYNQTTYEFQLGPLSPADAGQYSVVLVDAGFNLNQGQTTLEVLEPVADVTVISSLPEAVEFNSTVILTCSAKGSFLSYKWLNGSTPVVVDGNHLVLNGSQLIITEVLRTDLRGSIYCIAENLLESVKSPAFNMSVSYGPESITMKKVPDDVIQKKGSNLTLSCSAVSSPAAELKWLFNGAELTQKTAMLAFTNLEENQSGNYSCVAYNSKTKRYAASQVVTVSIIEAISGTNITGPTSLLIAGNSTANLTCKSSVGRADSVSWFKDDKPLAASDRVIISTDKRTISIPIVQKEDAGKYKCELSNKLNRDSSIYNMQIYYGPEKVSIEGPKKAEVVDTVVMTCKVASVPPATYIWKFNGSLLEITTAEYKIEKPSLENSGIYTCEAYNHITGLSQKATHNLLVKGEGELNDQLSSGAIAAIVIAVLLVVAIIIGVIIRKRRKPGDIASPY
ncbi:carcinoembryonic antigen-related cell adhesion molecule 20 [Colossoma macropomum]|uniref:carcinoembryonic antigen-related cell adhesion molecule 20 n=1 Tax=Colossoma macropomum TaxID=42526 RepID=UPI001863C1E6|nr:carcinoembryonic antigen-related cell adhesion molecule 20 [Colossoma macropomum]